jgi:DNA polymerase-3 subunit delta'
MQAGRLPTALLLVGPSGVGKQRLALWVAQGLVCDSGPGEPCGSCQACRRALGLAHPDVHWFFPIPRPRGEEAKQAEEAEEALGAALAARRENPLAPPPDGMAGLFLPLVRALHRRAQLRPALARRKVFVLGRAERLVPQAANPEAANAMLKLLEEPPPDTYLILTTSEPAALLPTIRSRLVPLRVGRVPADVVHRFLVEVPVPPLSDAEAKRRADWCGGSIGDALAMGGADQGAGAAARTLIEAARQGAAARYRFALGVRPYAARGEFTDTLDAAAEILRDELAGVLRGDGRGTSAGTGRTDGLLKAIREIEQARRLAQGNVNPQLVTADLLRRLSECPA